jgi:hypothetical protein
LKAPLHISSTDNIMVGINDCGSYETVKARFGIDNLPKDTYNKMVPYLQKYTEMVWKAKIECDKFDVINTMKEMCNDMEAHKTKQSKGLAMLYAFEMLNTPVGQAFRAEYKRFHDTCKKKLDEFMNDKDIGHWFQPLIEPRGVDGAVEASS